MKKKLWALAVVVCAVIGGAPVAPVAEAIPPAPAAPAPAVCIEPCSPDWATAFEDDGATFTRWRYAHDGVGPSQCHCMFRIYVRLRNLDTGEVIMRWGHNVTGGDWTRQDEDDGNCHVQFTTLDSCPNSSVGWNHHNFCQLCAPEPSYGFVVVAWEAP